LPEFAAHVLEDHSPPISDWNFRDLSPLMPRATNLPATDSEPLQLTPQDQPPPMSVPTGLSAPNEVLSNTNFINFPLGGRHKNNLKDRRSLAVRIPHASQLLCPLISYFQTIIRAECRRLCGAIEYSEINTRQNTYSIRRRKYILPDLDDTPRRDANGMRLHNPQWGRPVTDHINEQFTDAVIDAVQLVPVSCTSWQYMSCIWTHFVPKRPSPQLGASGRSSTGSSKLTFGICPTIMRSRCPPDGWICAFFT
jgi:hypothetical protein